MAYMGDTQDYIVTGYGGVFDTKAHGVAKLIETAIDCGIEKNADLFWGILNRVYPNNEAAFSEAMQGIMGAVVERQASAIPLNAEMDCPKCMYSFEAGEASYRYDPRDN